MAISNLYAGVWKISTGELVANMMKHNQPINAIALSSDGRYMATASWDGYARIWDLKSESTPILLRHDDKVEGVAFNFDGTSLATASSDGYATVWDIDTRNEILKIGTNNRMIAVAFSSNGTLISSASKKEARMTYLDPKNLIWESCDRLTCNLTSAEWRDQYCQ
jgi:WD40 repeat protein